MLWKEIKVEPECCALYFNLSLRHVLRINGNHLYGPARLFTFPPYTLPLSLRDSFYRQIKVPASFREEVFIIRRMLLNEPTKYLQR